MLHKILKDILCEKLRLGFIAWIRYFEFENQYERPFKLVRVGGNSLELIDCCTEEYKTLSYDDMINFYIHHENDVNKCIEKSYEKINKYKSILNKLDFISEKKFYDLIFNVETIETTPILNSHAFSINILAFFNLIKSTDIKDYKKFFNGDEGVLIKLRFAWKNLIMKKYNEVMDSLDKELQIATDESIKLEIKAIKETISTIPSDVEKEINSRDHTTLLDYWPILLLPKSNILDK